MSSIAEKLAWCGIVNNSSVKNNKDFKNNHSSKMYIH